jgi:hypothetical protein
MKDKVSLNKKASLISETKQKKGKLSIGLTT